MYGRKRQFSVSVPRGRSGYTDRKCPECNGVFKLMLGTGLAGIEDCHCPYCGFYDHNSNFHTEAQLEYAKSVALDSIMSEFDSSIRQMQRNVRRLNRQSQGLLKLTIKVNSSPRRVVIPADLKLETYVECANCTLKYAVYGVYAYCPDCGKHNAVQMLENNLETSGKLLELADGLVDADDALVGKLISKALTDVVASFDGFGRTICETYASKSSNPSQAEKIRFQNLIGARSSLRQYFGFDLAGGLTQAEWELAIRCFQKRHVLEHRSGVVDEDYKARAKDPKAIVGRKVSLSKNEVRRLNNVVCSLGTRVFAEMEKLL